jgi:hypothetical protein
MEDAKLLATVHDNGTVIISFQSDKNIVVLEFASPFATETGADDSKYNTYHKSILYQYNKDLILTKEQPSIIDYVKSLANILGYQLVKDSNISEILPKIQWERFKNDV